MEKISSYLDNFSELTGKVCSWFVAIMVLVTCLVVIMRYGLDMGSVFLHLDAEVNWYREFHNLIAGFSQNEIELKQKNLISIAKIRKDL